MFDKLAMTNIYGYSAEFTPNTYDLESAVDGSQYIFGVQLGASYRISDNFGVFGGARIDYLSSGYNGFLLASRSGNVKLMELGMDVKQSTFGVTPIV
jgi:long-chain fatty acid transport protein